MQVAMKMLRKKFPGKFKIMDESLAGSDIGSAPNTSRRASQLEGKDDFAEGIRNKEGSLTYRCSYALKATATVHEKTHGYYCGQQLHLASLLRIPSSCLMLPMMNLTDYLRCI